MHEISQTAHKRWGRVILNPEARLEIDPPFKAFKQFCVEELLWIMFWLKYSLLRFLSSWDQKVVTVTGLSSTACPVLPEAVLLPDNLRISCGGGNKRPLVAGCGPQLLLPRQGLDSAFNTPDSAPYYWAGVGSSLWLSVPTNVCTLTSLLKCV